MSLFAVQKNTKRILVDYWKFLKKIVQHYRMANECGTGEELFKHDHAQKSQRRVQCPFEADGMYLV